MTEQLDFEKYQLYGGRPPHSDKETSLEAAISMEGSVGRLQRVVYNLIVREGGMTCDEVEIETGLAHQTASARVTELHQLGKIEWLGDKRLTRSGRRAKVWVALP